MQSKWWTVLNQRAALPAGLFRMENQRKILQSSLFRKIMILLTLILKQAKKSSVEFEMIFSKNFI